MIKIYVEILQQIWGKIVKLIYIWKTCKMYGGRCKADVKRLKKQWGNGAEMVQIKYRECVGKVWKYIEEKLLRPIWYMVNEYSLLPIAIGLSPGFHRCQICYGAWWYKKFKRTWKILWRTNHVRISESVCKNTI